MPPKRKLTKAEADRIVSTNGSQVGAELRGVTLERTHNPPTSVSGYVDRSTTSPSGALAGTAAAAYHTSFSRARAHSARGEHFQAMTQYQFEASARSAPDAGHLAAKNSAVADRNRHQQLHFDKQRKDLLDDWRTSGNDLMQEAKDGFKSLGVREKRGAAMAQTSAEHRVGREVMESSEAQGRINIFDEEAQAREHLHRAAAQHLSATLAGAQTKSNAQQALIDAAFSHELSPAERRARTAETRAAASRDTYVSGGRKQSQSHTIHQPPIKGRR